MSIWDILSTFITDEEHLTTCRLCNGKVSSKATVCPHCGCEDPDSDQRFKCHITSDVCRSCNGKVSSEAKICPHCGCKDPAQHCYITTAVCRSENKPDDCYELEMFRKFRDTWLKLQPDGIELIEKYYHTAPMIVRMIDASDNSTKIYSEIKNKYLNRCLYFIEHDMMEECKILYVKMVSELTDEYL